MATENLNLLQRAIEAFNRRDFQAAASALDENSEWDWSRSIGPDKAVYRGPTEITRFWEEFAGGFDEVRIEIEDVVEKENWLVAEMLSVMRGRDGIEVEARNAWLITGGAGKLRRLEMFQTKSEALEAAGVLE